MSSCLSVSSSPINFSAACIISFEMRRGVAEGRAEGEGAGVGVGVCAIAFNGELETARPAAPAAGSSFTKLRRLREVRFDFFMMYRLRVSPPSRVALMPRPLRPSRAVLHLYYFCFAGSINRDDIEVVVLSFRNSRILGASERPNDFRHSVVVTSDKNCLAGILRANLSQQVGGIF